MNVLYTCDDGYVWLMGVSVISLFENNKHIQDLTVYLLGEHISDKNKMILQELAVRYGRKVLVIDVPEFDIPEKLVSARWPLSAFTRLFSGQLLPDDVERILYLDCDTIIRGDLGPLYAADRNSYIFYGVKDCIGRLYKENIGLDENDAYINAGVLLINLYMLRKIDMQTAVDQYMKKYVEFINYADQDILNGIFKGKIGILSPCYDVMTINVVYTYEEINLLRKPVDFYGKEELEEAVRNPVIIHYTTNMRTIRPWYSNTNHPLAAEFKKYMEISPWKNKKLRNMKFTSKESRIIGVIDKFPKTISHKLLGIMHSKLKPIYIKWKAN